MHGLGYNVLEQAVYGGDMDLIKYLLIEREVDVKGKSSNCEPS